MYAIYFPNTIIVTFADYPSIKIAKNVFDKLIIFLH
jgi:hypothetical protein